MHVQNTLFTVLRVYHKLEQPSKRIHPDGVTEFLYSSAAVYASTKLSTVTNPPTYTAVVSNDLSNVIKSAVFQSIREQKEVERNKSCIAIHGMQKYCCDLSDVQELCRYLEYSALVISALRIGRFNKSANKPRLLKVQFQTTTNKSLLLRVAKFLRDDLSTSSI